MIHVPLERKQSRAYPWARHGQLGATWATTNIPTRGGLISPRDLLLEDLVDLPLGCAVRLGRTRPTCITITMGIAIPVSREAAESSAAVLRLHHPELHLSGKRRLLRRGQLPLTEVVKYMYTQSCTDVVESRD